MFPSDNGGRQRFELLDGMRGLAALAIVADHVSTPTVQGLTLQRALAVDFFFVLSGFVLAHAYGARLAGVASPRLGPFHFAAMRFARFWPMLAIAFAISIAYTAYGATRWNLARSPEEWAAQVGFGLLFLPPPPQLSPIGPFSLLGPAHTMFFELFANFVLAAIAPFLTRSRLIALLGVSALALSALALRWNITDFGFRWDTFLPAFVRVTYTFFAGVAVYLLWRSRTMPSLPPWLAFLALAALLCAPVTGAAAQAYQLAASLVMFPLLVLFSAGARLHGRALWLCLQAGALSYGLYILHEPIHRVLEALFLKIAPQIQDVWLYLVVLAVTLGAVLVLRPTYDLPMQKRLRAILK